MDYSKLFKTAEPETFYDFLAFKEKQCRVNDCLIIDTVERYYNKLPEEVKRKIELLRPRHPLAVIMNDFISNFINYLTEDGNYNVFQDMNEVYFIHLFPEIEDINCSIEIGNFVNALSWAGVINKNIYFKFTVH